MANAFSKEERVAFEDILAGFNDALVLSRNVSIYRTDSSMMERANNIIWRPMPYIARSYSGTDMSANFLDNTQLSVPSSLGFARSSPWVMNATDLRDALQENRLGDAAKLKLASDINVSISDVAANQGTVVVKRTAAASGYDDVAQMDAAFNEIGVQADNRYLALSSRDYNNMAGNLSQASRSFGNAKSDQAYERSYVGPIAGFETYKLDYASRLTPAAGGGAITMSTLDAGGNYYVPKATNVASTGETANVDNRYQTITVTSTTSVKAGDAFTIANLNAVHLITKRDTGQPKTFRVISVPSSTTLVISPPIITNQVPDAASTQYQNCVINTKASNSAIVWLNTVSAAVNVFWHRDALEILPGRYAVPTDAGAAVMRGTTDQGIELVMQKQYDIKTMKTNFRIDTLYGVVNKQPEMSGICLFSQT